MRLRGNNLCFWRVGGANSKVLTQQYCLGKGPEEEGVKERARIWVSRYGLDPDMPYLRQSFLASVFF